MQQRRTAKYLLRFDDICPTMNWNVWSKIESDLVEQGINPILAVVPDNQDPALRVDAAAGDFWGRVREWQSRGWPIALHGFQHRYVAQRRGLVTPKKNTEFAGVPAAEQEEKIRRGIEIFQREGIKPRLWVAPSNSFDATTVFLLRKFGIRVICDGYFRFPFHWPDDVLWIPQQLFGFRPAPAGVWTVCYHHNHWTTSELAAFRQDVRRFRPRLGSLDEVLTGSGGFHSWGSFWLATHPRFSEVVIRTELKLWNSFSLRRNMSWLIRSFSKRAEPGSASN